eukprot:GCRY01006256.1.p1 GENE.GCRY01006256.1~~GCRY01006256.1.p1  ORF type:complete len:552 (-),score=44.05 GCRY01006256.1:38-1693(-)
MQNSIQSGVTSTMPSHDVAGVRPLRINTKIFGEDVPEGRVSVHSKVERVLFAFLFDMLKDRTPNRFFSFIAVFVTFFQLQSFVFDTDFVWTSNDDNMFSSFIQLFRVNSSIFSSIEYRILFWISFLITIYVLICVLYIGLEFQIKSHIKRLWPVKSIRILLSLLVYFSLNMLAIFTHPLLCSNDKLDLTDSADHPIACNSTEVWFMRVFGLMGLLIQGGFLVITRLVYHSHSITSRDFTGRAHGRLEALFELVKIVLMLGFAFLSSSSEIPYRLVFFVIIASLFWFANYIYLPYYNKYFLYFQNGSAFCFCFGSIFATVNYFLVDNHPSLLHESLSFSPFFYVYLVLIPFFFFCGSYIAKHRISSLSRDFTNVDFYLRVESSEKGSTTPLRRQFVVDGHAHSALSLPGSTQQVSSPSPFSSSPEQRDSTQSLLLAEAHGVTARDDALSDLPLSGSSVAAAFTPNPYLETDYGPCAAHFSHEVEIATRVLLTPWLARANCSYNLAAQDTLRLVNARYHAAGVRFPADPLVCLYFSRFLFDFCKVCLGTVMLS